jgi:hypothetical protein
MSGTPAYFKNGLEGQCCIGADLAPT